MVNTCNSSRELFNNTQRKELLQAIHSIKGNAEKVIT